jgi:hypothetical protein
MVRADERLGLRMSEKSTDPRIDKFTIIYVDGKVYARCYSGKNFTDAVVSPGCLGNMVADGAKILVTINAEIASALSAKAEETTAMDATS